MGMIPSSFPRRRESRGGGDAFPFLRQQKGDAARRRGFTATHLNPL